MESFVFSNRKLVHALFTLVNLFMVYQVSQLQVKAGF